MTLEINSKTENNVGYLNLKGVLDISSIDTFKRNISGVQGVKQVNIDFNDVSLIDSTGVAALTQGIKVLRDAKVDIKVKNIPMDVFDVLDIAGLTEMFGSSMFESKAK